MWGRRSLYPAQMPDDDPNLVTVATALARHGVTGKAQREALHSGKVWLDATPLTHPGREVDPRRLRLELQRPRFDPRTEPAVVFRDARFVVVYKPSGVLSVPAPGRREQSVISAVQRWFGRSFAVHRIDEGTSGLLLVALDEGTQTALKSRFEIHDIEREYLAVVHGRFPDGTRTFRSTLLRDRGDGKRGSGSDGKPAVTHVTGLEGSGKRSLVRARLETGRTHQVRIHLSEAGFPLVGDDLYGRERGPRLMLHATHLGFAHPTTGARLTFDSPPPDDFEWPPRTFSAPRPAPRRTR